MQATPVPVGAAAGQLQDPPWAGPSPRASEAAASERRAGPEDEEAVTVEEGGLTEGAFTAGRAVWKPGASGEAAEVEEAKVPPVLGGGA